MVITVTCPLTRHIDKSWTTERSRLMILGRHVHYDIEIYWRAKDFRIHTTSQMFLAKRYSDRTKPRWTNQFQLHVIAFELIAV